MLNSLRQMYSHIWVIDTEFRCPTGGRNIPVCLCAHDLISGARIECFFDRQVPNPFLAGDALFICYNAAAEWKTFLALGWELPANIIDLYFEYQLQINGVWIGNTCLRTLGTGLVDALAEYNIGSLSHGEKDLERDYILRHVEYPPEGQRRILDYCWTDVYGTEKLLSAMLDEIDLEQALLRSSYSRSVAWFEWNGLPIDPSFALIEERREQLRVDIASQVERQHSYGVYEIIGQQTQRPVFRQRKFDELVRKNGLWDAWPKTPRGTCRTADKEVLKPMSVLYPALKPLRDAKRSISALAQSTTLMSTDFRSRATIFPFATKTGRNSAKASQFILARPHWMRFFIKPPDGRALVYTDLEAAEPGIAADASGDPEMIRIYNSGADQYLAFAASAGAIPAGTVRDKTNATLEGIRNLYKSADLALRYGVSPPTLATNLGIPLWQADHIHASHRRAYPVYWDWAEAQIEQAYKQGYIETCLGWRMAVYRYTDWKCILNFPQQAACAEILRLACIVLEEKGFGPSLCAPLHDALYLECDLEKADGLRRHLEDAFLNAANVVMSGRVQLRLDTGIVRFPDHYTDDKGKALWETIQGHIAASHVEKDQVLISLAD